MEDAIQPTTRKRRRAVVRIMHQYPGIAQALQDQGRTPKQLWQFVGGRLNLSVSKVRRSMASPEPLNWNIALAVSEYLNLSMSKFARS